MLASPSVLPSDLAVLDDDVERARFTRETIAPGGRHMAESSLRVAGMHRMFRLS